LIVYHIYQVSHECSLAYRIKAKSSKMATMVKRRLFRTARAFKGVRAETFTFFTLLVVFAKVKRDYKLKILFLLLFY